MYFNLSAEAGTHGEDGFGIGIQLEFKLQNVAQPGLSLTNYVRVK